MIVLMALMLGSTLRRTVDPSINTISTLLLAVTLLLWVIAFFFTTRAARTRRRALDELLVETR